MKSWFLVFSLAFTLMICSLNAQAGEFKTINLAMPTNYGTFLGEIHYHKNDLAIALKVERIVKEDLIKVVNYFKYVPRDIVHFNIDHYMRLTNGNARTFPTNIINLYNFPANNHEHLITLEDWMQGLLLHEFVHIVHLDQTRDYLEVGRNIFGTIAKVPTGIVPRWFTEAIAVWGESHFINGGRLNNPLFNKELLLLLKNKKFCQTLDCLDDPGVFPSGQLAYWAGAQFMEYLEKSKANSIKCLVEENSSAIPFFLNDAFETCVGQTAQESYLKFKENFLASEPPAQFEQNEWREKIENAFGTDDFQKGIVLDSDRLYKVEHHKDNEALVSYDLKNKQHFIGRFNLPISDVSSIAELGCEKRWLLASFNDDPHYRSHNKIWKLINPDTLLVERTLDFKNDPSYVIHLYKDDFLTFSYIENKWQAYKNEKLLKTFSSDDSINMVKRVGNKLLLKINNSWGVSSLILTDLKLEKLTLIYKSNNFFDIPFVSENFLVKREKGEFKLLEWDNDLSKVLMSDLKKEKIQGVVFAEYNNGRAIVLEDRLKSANLSGLELDNLLKNEKSNTLKVETKEFVDQMPASSSYASSQAENYPRVDHLLPHYWFLASGNSDNLGSIGATTSFSDPMGIHTLNTTGYIYPSVTKMGGAINYVQKLVNVSDLWKVTASFSQDYSKTEFSSTVNLSRNLMATTYYEFYLKEWTYTPEVFVGKATDEDFISYRTTTQIGLNNNLAYSSLSTYEFIQRFNSQINFLTNKTTQGDSFYSTYLSAMVEGRFSSDFSAIIDTTFEKLNKSDFRRGVIYAGGISDVIKPRQHGFYGLPYGNAYGNKVFTTKEMIDYSAWDIYRGKNFIPFYLKELHFLAGLESLYADRIFLKDDFLRDTTINGFFMGPRLKADAFYFVPMSIDVIYSSIKNPYGGRANQVDFIISADLSY